MDNIVVEVKNLTKKFGPPAGGFTAVDNISFSIKTGEIVGLLGPNGAGKTTTIDMLLGILKPTFGDITIFGKPFEQNRQNILQEMNFSAAYINLPWKMKIWENLYTFGRLYQIKNYKEKSEELIEEFMLTDLRNKFIKDLSSGQQARVYLCKAFINDPKLLLLDEPTAFMDPDVADTLRKLIMKKVREKNTTVIFTSHNMAEVTELCDRVIFLNKGKIVAEDTPVALAKKIGSCHVNLMIIDGQKRTLNWCRDQKLEASAEGRYVTVKLPEKEIASFLSKLADIGVEYDEISIEKPTLEDFFLRITREGKI
ncbi:ABC transporter ATP-binding protein [Candidatus Gottesmanbacteria bacterium]|nr:ABC transporter ATP-binding protein [Candidatus Gottesmanbacteria bacterium]